MSALGLTFPNALLRAKAPLTLPMEQSEVTFSTEGNEVKCYLRGIPAPTRLLHVTDTHLFMDDERGKLYQPYSGRMAKAYNETIHFETGESTNPEKSFLETISLAKEQKVDLLGLSGDIFSFPSESAIEWVMELLTDSGINYLYTAGNHDWHYEGMKGSLHELRETWIEKRLKPLYQGGHPLMNSQSINGIKFISMDNSLYEITEEQLAYFRKESNTDAKVVLLVHIPLYAPGRSVGYGCGHPEWGAKTDTGFKIEGRERWPEKGHSPITFDFHKEVFQGGKVVAVFAGHVHKQTIDIVNGIPQFLAPPNAMGGFLDVEFLPLGKG
ncbi:metallophosphoesterase family protein [Pleomorphovibrio marinus]|uniref:metallophosphoesterase family protein n=1 Tax=Pleomorphovibrio marinus TaxID=2164132 RepID=UPI001E596AB0|nr:metallophosphoesterase [Pleomorphovibrio marinus]